MTEPCPFCDDPGYVNSDRFSCGTIWFPILKRSEMCYEREIASLKEELASESAWAKEYKEKAEKQEIDIATLLKEGRELNNEMASWRTYFKERLDATREYAEALERGTGCHFTVEDEANLIKKRQRMIDLGEL